MVLNKVMHSWRLFPYLRPVWSLPHSILPFWRNSFCCCAIPFLVPFYSLLVQSNGYRMRVREGDGIDVSVEWGSVISWMFSSLTHSLSFSSASEIHDHSATFAATFSISVLITRMNLYPFLIVFRDVNSIELWGKWERLEYLSRNGESSCFPSDS